MSSNISSVIMSWFSYWWIESLWNKGFFFRIDMDSEDSVDSVE